MVALTASTTISTGSTGVVKLIIVLLRGEQIPGSSRPDNEIFYMAPNICGSSVQYFLHVTILSRRILN
jgi:hypothetical protein